jgi:hypothetical protein
MKKIKLPLLLFCVSLFMISCKKDEDSKDPVITTPSSDTDWLQTGHVMVFSYESDLLFSDSMTVEVFEKNSAGAYRVVSIVDGIPVITTTTYEKIINGDLYYSANADFKDYQLILKGKNAAVGDKWSYTGTSTSGAKTTTQNEVVKLNESTTVKAGTFSCVKIQSVSTISTPGSSPVNMIFHYNQAAGIIKSYNTTEILGDTYVSADVKLVRKNF